MANAKLGLRRKQRKKKVTILYIQKIVFSHLSQIIQIFYSCICNKQQRLKCDSTLTLQNVGVKKISLFKSCEKPKRSHALHDGPQKKKKILSCQKNSHLITWFLAPCSCMNNFFFDCQDFHVLKMFKKMRQKIGNYFWRENSNLQTNKIQEFWR